jgi:hypothetical protein
MTSCIVDDDRCGPGERAYNDLFEGCVCQTGYVPNADGVGCHACGANQESKGGACVCSDGYGRSTVSAPCVLGGGADEPDAGDGSTAVSGQDMPCNASSDCADTDATYCLTLQSPHVCLVQGCASGATRCSSERECCEIDVLPELAATSGLCVPKGKCTAPGMVVNP